MPSSEAHLQRMTPDAVTGLTVNHYTPAPSPLDFLKGIDVGYIQRQRLERCASPKQSLCAKVETAHGGVYFLGHHLPWDSEHFGLKTIRIEDIFIAGRTGDPERNPQDDARLLHISIQCWNDFLKHEGIEYAVGNFDARSNVLLRELSIAGYVPLEIRVNYWRTLRDYDYPRRFKVRLAEAHADLESLQEAAVNNANPLDRFHADPVLSRTKVDELMRLWVRNSIESDFADGALVPDMSPPDAFCTFQTHNKAWPYWGVKASQPILAAVSPNRSGWYVKIMSELSYHLKEQGADVAFMTTQLGNAAVLRTWNALGYTYGSGEVTVRWVPVNTKE